MSSLLEPSKVFKPFKHPWAVEIDDEHERMHWIQHEVPMGEDVTDWKTDKINDNEKAFVTQILRMFTQADVAVGNFYDDLLIPKFQNNEVRNMLKRFSGREVTHQQAYALLNDTLGLPEGEYSAFMKFKEMSDKADFMMDADPSTHSGLALALAKGVFNEGVSLFASFAMLLSFQRRGLMKAMGKIVEWSIKDETKHVEGVAKLFHAYCGDFPHIVTDQFKHHIYDMARTCVELEDAFIESAYALSGDIEGLPKEQVKLYIRFVADRRLVQLGLKPNFMIESNPLPWLDWVVSSTRHTNFFESKVAEYEKGGLQGEWKYSPRNTMLRVYSRDGCEFCAKAKELLVLRGFKFETVDLSDDHSRQVFFNSRGMKDNDRTMPKVYQIDPGVGEKLIGGYTETAQFIGEM